MFGECCVGATSFFQGVGQDRQAVKDLLLVNGLRQVRNGAGYSSAARRIKETEAKRVGEDFPEEVQMPTS